MPPKKSKAKPSAKKRTKAPRKRYAAPTMQVVATPRTVGEAGFGSALGVFAQRAPTLSPLTGVPVALPAQQTSTAITEYNTLLKELAEEKKARAASQPPLAPNTMPLTANRQENDLLKKKLPEATPLKEGTFPESWAEKVVGSITYDDPTANENMYDPLPRRQAESIVQALPLGEFDEMDVLRYDNAEARAQSALAKTPKQKYAMNLNQAYIEYVALVEDANKTYGLGIKILPKSQLKSKERIQEAMNVIQAQIDEVPP